MKLILVFTLMIWSSLAFANQDILLQDISPDRQQEILAIGEKLRCVVCQSESVARSPAPLAQDMRQFIYDRLEQGQAQSEILQALQDRYGDQVVLRPPINEMTLILWLTPLAIIILGGIVIYRSTKEDE